jgi:hypothetical protein
MYKMRKVGLIYSGLIMFITISITVGCGQMTNRSFVPDEIPYNMLTEEETADGWELLFDGVTTDGWRGYLKQDNDIEGGWFVNRGMLVKKDTKGEAWGDIITTRKFENFIFETEWMIDVLGSSGIFYMVVEDYPSPGYSGPEFQMLDDLFWPEQLESWHYTGSAYGMYGPLDDAIKPSTYWNTSRIVVDKGHVEHWLNDVKVVEYQIGSKHWEELAASGKWPDYPSYGRYSRGHIALQDNGHQVSFRNMKIKVLD